MPHLQGTLHLLAAWLVRHALIMQCTWESSLTRANSLSTIAALILDIYVRRQQTSRGVYRLHDMEKPRGTGSTAALASGGYGQGGLAAPRESSAWEEPRPSIGPYSERAEPMFENKGYDVPQDQFAYDTGYHGHGAQDAKPYGA